MLTIELLENISVMLGIIIYILIGICIVYGGLILLLIRKIHLLQKQIDKQIENQTIIYRKLIDINHDQENS